MRNMANIKQGAERIPIPKKKRVAAYCRVSKDTANLLNSFDTQVSYYSEKIQMNKDWEFAGIYSDEAISGTRITMRDGFKQMVADCEDGKIDLILTKSASRFARNTVDTLETTRHLKSIGVEIYFEEQRISTFSSDGELMLTLMAAIAQEEVVSTSENIKWSRRKKFEQGDPQVHFKVYGYEWIDGVLTVIPEQAEVVKRIFRDYIGGKSSYLIAKELKDEGYKTIRDAAFDDQAVIYILKNYTYTGNLLLQKTVVVDAIAKKKIRNKGQYAQFKAEGTHEPIIDMETYEKAQALIKERGSKGWGHNRYSDTTCFYQKIICGRCGRYYVHCRKKRKDGSIASSFYCGCRPARVTNCGNCQIAEETLWIKIAEALGIDKFDENEFLSRVDHVEVLRDAPLKIYMKDGQIIEKQWKRRIKYAEGYNHPTY